MVEIKDTSGHRIDDGPSRRESWRWRALNRAHFRCILVVLWMVVVASSLFLFFFRHDLIRGELESASTFSVMAGSVVYLFFGGIRAFTFIPATYLVVSAIPFFPAPQLFVLTLIGILISSASTYYFAKALHLDEVLARKHTRQIVALHSALKRYELPFIIGWSFCPVAPTDLICYVCGVLKIDFRKCMLGVAIGEGAICAIYIFAGDFALRVLHFRS
jgi:uncharacterized membrane protein YdjX (TVP38/TMEM64 family)